MKGTEIRKDPGIGDMLEELFRHASVRERAPESDETAIREALHAQWRELSGRRRRRRNRLVLGAAASVILAIFAGSQLLQGPAPPASPVTVASIEKSIGSVTVRDLGGGRIKGSMRSRGRVDVGAIAESFGGGGHHNAAGFTATSSVDQVMAAIRELLEPIDD